VIRVETHCRAAYDQYSARNVDHAHAFYLQLILGGMEYVLASVFTFFPFSYCVLILSNTYDLALGPFFNHAVDFRSRQNSVGALSIPAGMADKGGVDRVLVAKPIAVTTTSWGVAK